MCHLVISERHLENMNLNLANEHKVMLGSKKDDIAMATCSRHRFCTTGTGWAVCGKTVAVKFSFFSEVETTGSVDTCFTHALHSRTHRWATGALPEARQSRGSIGPR